VWDQTVQLESVAFLAAVEPLSRAVSFCRKTGCLKMDQVFRARWRHAKCRQIPPPAFVVLCDFDYGSSIDSIPIDASGGLHAIFALAVAAGVAAVTFQTGTMPQNHRQSDRCK